jgi:hypothetical protein
MGPLPFPFQKFRVHLISGRGQQELAFMAWNTGPLQSQAPAAPNGGPVPRCPTARGLPSSGLPSSLKMQSVFQPPAGPKNKSNLRCF